MDAFWFGLGVAQVGFAAYALTALLTWRGERLWPGPGAPLAPLAAALGGLLFAGAVVAMAWANDAEFSRYLGTGALMLVALGVFVATARRSRRGD